MKFCSKEIKSFPGYTIRGLKLSLVLILGTLIMILPNLLVFVQIALTPAIGLVLWIISLAIGITLNGYLITKFGGWIFK